MENINIYIKDETYHKIEQLIKWLNLDNQFKNRNKKEVTVEDFVKGAVMDKIDEYWNFYENNPLSERNINKNVKVKNNFKLLAKKKKLTQKQISEIIGVHNTNLSSIFSNDSQPRMDLFIKLWISLGCPKLSDCIYLEDDTLYVDGIPVGED